MQVPKAEHHLQLLSMMVLLVLLVSCSASGEYEIETFDLGNGRSIEILASNDAEVSQSFYYQVKVDGNIVIPLFMMCVGHDRGQLEFRALLAKDGDLVGIFEQKFPEEILAIHDFKANASWPRMPSEYKNPEEHEQYGAALLKDLQAEHQDIQLRLGQKEACE
jgi:hypothetical protein